MNDAANNNEFPETDATAEWIAEMSGVTFDHVIHVEEVIEEAVAVVPEPPAAVPVQTALTGMAWVSQQTSPYFAEIGNGLYVRTGTGKKRRRRY